MVIYFFDRIRNYATYIDSRHRRLHFDVSFDSVSLNGNTLSTLTVQNMLRNAPEPAAPPIVFRMAAIRPGGALAGRAMNFAGISISHHVARLA